MMARIIIWSSLVLLPFLSFAQWSQAGDRYCLSFGGDTEVVFNNESRYDFTSDIKLEFDVLYHDLTTNAFQGIISKKEAGGATVFGVKFNPSTNVWHWYFNDGSDQVHSIAVSGNFVIDTWYHIECSFTQNGSDVDSEIIINGGTPATTTLTSSTLTANTANLVFGRSNSGAEYFDGKLDNVTITGDGAVVGKFSFEEGIGTSMYCRLGSTTGTITIGSGEWFAKNIPPFDPTTIAGLTVWLDATNVDGDGNPGNNSGDYTTWADLSGNGNDFTAASGKEPTYNSSTINSKPGMDFSSPDVMSTGAISSLDNVNEYTIIFVLQANSKASTYYPFGLWQNSYPSNASIYFLTGINGPFSYVRRNSGGIVYTSYAFDVTDPWSHVFTWDGTTFKEFINGVEGTTQSGPTDLTFTTHINTYLGGFNSSSNFVGTICEVLIFDNDITGSDLTDVETYLTDKYGL